MTRSTILFLTNTWCAVAVIGTFWLAFLAVWAR